MSLAYRLDFTPNYKRFYARFGAKFVTLAALLCTVVTSNAQTLGVAHLDQFLATPDQPFNENVTTNDVLPLGTGPAKVVLVQTTSHGTLTLATDGNFTYVPTAGFIGADSFRYQLVDTSGERFNIATARIAVGGISGFSVPTTAVGGMDPQPQGYLYLNYTPTTATAITMSSSSTSVATVPSTLTIASGSNYTPFEVTTKAQSTSRFVIVYAVLNGCTYGAKMLVTPVVPSYVSAPTVTGGDGKVTSASVVLVANAPAAGTTVTLKSSVPSLVSVPTSVKVAGGESQATFTYTANAQVSVPRSVRIYATAGGRTAYGTVQVLPYYVTLSPQYPSRTGTFIVGCVDFDGTYNRAKVNLQISSTAPPGGVKVSLVGDCPIGGLTMPSSVTVPAGATSTAFDVSVTNYLVPADVEGGVTVTVYANYLVQSAQTGISLAPVSLRKFDLYNGYTHAFAGETIPLFVDTYGYAKSTGTAISLMSSSSSAVSPTTVTIPSGGDEFVFNVLTKPVTASAPIMLTAELNGTTKSISFVLLPAQVEDVLLNDYELKSGVPVPGIVILHGVAGSTGAPVTFECSSALLTPTKVTVAPGKSAVAFTLTPGTVTVPTGVLVHAYTWKSTGFGMWFYVTISP